MAKVTTTENKIGPIGTFLGPWETKIEDKDGVVARGRGFNPQESRQNAENNYDDKTRGK